LHRFTHTKLHYQKTKYRCLTQPKLLEHISYISCRITIIKDSALVSPFHGGGEPGACIDTPLQKHMPLGLSLPAQYCFYISAALYSMPELNLEECRNLRDPSYRIQNPARRWFGRLCLPRVFLDGAPCAVERGGLDGPG